MIHPATFDLDTLVARAIYQTLGPVLAAYQYNGGPRIYWRRAVQGAPLPYWIAQPQSGTNRVDRVGSVGVTGLYLVKVLADPAVNSPQETRALLTLITPALMILRGDDHTFDVRYVSSPPLPATQTAWQVGHIVRINYG